MAASDGDDPERPILTELQPSLRVELGNQARSTQEDVI